MVFGDGKIVWFGFDDEEKGDLFCGVVGVVGMLGVMMCLEIWLMDVKKFVKMRYYCVRSVVEVVEVIRWEVRNDDNDFVDGIFFSRDYGVVVMGEFIDVKFWVVELWMFFCVWD